MNAAQAQPFEAAAPLVPLASPGALQVFCLDSLVNMSGVPSCLPANRPCTLKFRRLSPGTAWGCRKLEKSAVQEPDAKQATRVALSGLGAQVIHI